MDFLYVRYHAKYDVIHKTGSSLIVFCCLSILANQHWQTTKQALFDALETQREITTYGRKCN